MLRFHRVSDKIAKWAWRGGLASLALGVLVVAIEYGAEFAFGLEPNPSRHERFLIVSLTAIFVLVGFPAVAVVINDLADEERKDDPS
jgi:hypothetical protein